MIYIAGDKHGYNAIKFVEEYLHEYTIEFENLGVKKEGEDMKLENMIPSVTKKILLNKDNKGVLACGTGIGVEVGVKNLVVSVHL